MFSLLSSKLTASSPVFSLAYKTLSVTVLFAPVLRSIAYSVLVLTSFSVIVFSSEFTVTRPLIVFPVISVFLAALATVTAPFTVLSLTIQFAPFTVKLFTVFPSAVQSPLRAISPLTLLLYTVEPSGALNADPLIKTLFL